MRKEFLVFGNPKIEQPEEDIYPHEQGTNLRQLRISRVKRMYSYGG